VRFPRSTRERTGQQPKEDYGVVVRAANPFDESPLETKNKVLILGGTHGYGTHAAIKFVTNPSLKELATLVRFVGDNDFQALFRVDVRDNQGDEQTLQLVEIWIPAKKGWVAVYTRHEMAKETSDRAGSRTGKRSRVTRQLPRSPRKGR
jgi:hypothetical protein